MGKLFQVGISGSYGGLNLGDEAILEGMLAQLRASLPVEVTVFSRNPDDTRDRPGVARGRRLRGLPGGRLERSSRPGGLGHDVDPVHQRKERDEVRQRS